MTAENELLKIWNTFAPFNINRNRLISRKRHRNWEYYRDHKVQLLYFWKLKAKMDDCYKQNLTYDKEVSDLREEIADMQRLIDILEE